MMKLRAVQPVSRFLLPAALILAVGGLSAGALAADWPGFLGPDRDGRSPEKGLKLSWDEAGPPVRWSVATGEGYAMASVAGGRVFVFDRVNGKERLRALAAGDGSVHWSQAHPVAYEDSFGFSNGPRSNPLVAGDRVITFGVGGDLRCHAVADGKLLWHVDTARRYGVVTNFFGQGSNPLVYRDTLIALVGGSPEDTPGLQTGNTLPDGSALVGFDLETGEERWKTGQDLASYSSPVVAEVHGKDRGFVLARSGLIVFDPAAGKALAAHPYRAKKLYSVNAAAPVVVGDEVFLTESYQKGGTLLKLGKDDALTPVWADGRREQAMASHWATPVAVDGWLYGSHGENRGTAELRAVKWADGTVGWKMPGLGRTTQIVVDGKLVVLSEEGRLLVLAADPKAPKVLADGTPKGKDGAPLLKHPAWNAPAVADGLLYAAGDGRLVAFDLRSRP